MAPFVPVTFRELIVVIPTGFIPYSPLITFPDDSHDGKPPVAVYINPLPHMPILGSSNSAANKDNVKNMDIWGYSYLTE